MALKKFKQKTPDEILIKAPRAEHGFATFAHLNTVVEYLQNQPELLPAVVGRLLGELPIYADNQAAVDGGLDYGDSYLTPSGLIVVLLQ